MAAFMFCILFVSFINHGSAFRAKDIWDDPSDILAPISAQQSDINLLNLDAKIVPDSNIDSHLDSIGQKLASIDIPVPHANVPFSDSEPSVEKLAEEEKERLAKQIELSDAITAKANALREAAEKAKKEAQSKLHPQQQQQQQQLQQQPTQQLPQPQQLPQQQQQQQQQQAANKTESSSTSSTSDEIAKLQKQQEETQEVVKKLTESDEKEKPKHKLTRREREEKKERERKLQELKEQQEEADREKIRQQHELQDKNTKLTKEIIEDDGLYRQPETVEEDELNAHDDDDNNNKHHKHDGDQEEDEEQQQEGGADGDYDEDDGFVKPTYFFNLTKIREEEKRRLEKEEAEKMAALSSSGPGYETPKWKFNVTKLREEIRAEEQEKLELEGKLNAPDGTIAELTEEEMAKGAGKEVEEWLRNKIRHEELKKLLEQQKADLNETELLKKSETEGEGFTIPEYRIIHPAHSSSTGQNGEQTSTGPTSFEPVYKRTEEELWADWDEMEKEADRIDAERQLQIEQEKRDHTYVRAQVDGDNEMKYREAERELEEVEKQKALENRRLLRKEWERRKAEREQMVRNLTHPDIVFPKIVPKGQLDGEEGQEDAALVKIVDEAGNPLEKQRTRFSHVNLSQTVIGKMNATEKAALDARMKALTDEMQQYDLKLKAAAAERDRVKAAEKIQFDKMKQSGWDGQRFVQIRIP